MKSRLSRTQRRALRLFGCSAAFALPAASVAQASTVTVGSPFTVTPNGTATCGGPCTWANTALAESGANVTSPISGTIVRWRIAGGYTGGPFELRVIRSAGGGLYTGFGTSSPGQPVGSGENTFTTSLPVQAGDLIGLDETVGSGIPRSSAVPGSTESVWNPALGDGTSALAPTVNAPGFELLFNADVQPPPGIGSISPKSGSISGGRRVAIAGHDFSNASAVNFGAAAAISFTVDSDTQITATAPRRRKPGRVDLAVTTAAGATPTSAADLFTYKACRVPRLKGKNLRADKRKLKHAGCKLGRVKGHGNTVEKQSVKPGTFLPAHSKVGVKLG
jgi:hypothetical protein